MVARKNLLKLGTTYRKVNIMSDLKKNTEEKATGRGRQTRKPAAKSTKPAADKKPTGRGRTQSQNKEASEARIEKEASTKRAKRVPMARAKKLDVKPKPGYYRHWFSQSNLAKAEAAYYSFVTDDEGAKITRPAGNGEARLFLMEIKEEFYREDVELARQNINDVVSDKVQNLGKDEYIPEGQANPMVTE